MRARFRAVLLHSQRARCCRCLCAAQVFCGALSRVWQFSDILEDARRVQQEQQEGAAAHAAALQVQQQQVAGEAEAGQAAAAAAVAPAQPCRQAILGDLNTMAHSVARLSRHYCCDALRWRSLGLSEAAWWQRHVLAVTGACLGAHAGAPCACCVRGASGCCGTDIHSAARAPAHLHLSSSAHSALPTHLSMPHLTRYVHTRARTWLHHCTAKQSLRP